MSSSLTLDFARTTTSRPRLGLPTVIQLHDELWRITRVDGEVLGYIERFDVGQDSRFRVKRFLPRQRRFLTDGEFWSMDDAVDCFRVA